MKRPLLTLAVASLCGFASLACDPKGNSNLAEDPAESCTDLCTSSGFASGRAEVFAHELNCFCEGGNAGASVAAAECSKTCLDLGWGRGEAFSASACQCS